jgi:hypothetical protein
MEFTLNMKVYSTEEFVKILTRIARYHERTLLLEEILGDEGFYESRPVYDENGNKIGEWNLA